MDAISRPMQILLAVVLAFAALWFVALRPSGDSGKSSSAPSAPGTEGLGRAVNGAKGAVAKSDASAQKTQAATGANTANTASGAAAGQASNPTSTSTGTSLDARVSASDRSKPLLAELKQGKVVVLLFWNQRASDDKSVHAVLREVDRHGGKVRVHSASVSRVADYTAITSGVQVLGSPTALVIDRKGHAKQITGFNDARAIDQAVGDALAGKLTA
jgi:hypothetical protein